MAKEQEMTNNTGDKSAYREKLIPTDANLKKLEESFDKVREKIVKKAQGKDHIEFVETDK